MHENLISSGESWRWVWPPETYRKVKLHLESERPRVTFRIVDATGNEWERVDNGEPRVVVDAPDDSGCQPRARPRSFLSRLRSTFDGLPVRSGMARDSDVGGQG